MLRIHNWLRSPKRVPLPEKGQLHLWLIDLKKGPEDYSPLLSNDEQTRSKQFLDPESHRRFTVARGSMRQILGNYLDIPAASVAFQYGPQGKPRLNSDRFGFNLSHAGERALLAVTGDEAVGVDIEPIHHRKNTLFLAKRVFDEAIFRRLLIQPAECLDQEFLKHWTMLEARAKAEGKGVFRGASKTTPVTVFQPDTAWVAAVAMSPRVPAIQDWVLYRCGRDTPVSGTS